MIRTGAAAASARRRAVPQPAYLPDVRERRKGRMADRIVLSGPPVRGVGMAASPYPPGMRHRSDMDLVGQALGVAVFIVVMLGLILLSGVSDEASYLEELLARGDISPEQYRRIQSARVGAI